MNEPPDDYTLTGLPDDIVRKALGYLNFDECRHASTVCNKFQEQLKLVSKDDEFWRGLFTGYCSCGKGLCSREEYIIKHYPTEFIKEVIKHQHIQIAREDLFQYACVFLRPPNLIDVGPWNSVLENNDKVMSSYGTLARVNNYFDEYWFKAEPDFFKHVMRFPDDVESEIKLSTKHMRDIQTVHNELWNEVSDASAYLKALPAETKSIFKIDEAEESLLDDLIKFASKPI